MDIGERMKLRRKQLKISADTVAKKLGVSRSTIFRYEKGDIEKLPTNILDDIAIILQTTPAYLMGWDEEKQAIFSIYNQLDKNRQRKVDKFAEQQLAEQKSIANFQSTEESKNSDIIHTLAAHSDDPDRSYSKEEIDHIESVLDNAKKKYEEKNGK